MKGASFAFVACLTLPATLPAEQCGPTPAEFVVLTSVGADGAVERAVCQPAAFAPFDETAAERWSQIGRWDVCGIEPERWDGSLTTRPGNPPDDDAAATFAAVGRFESVAEVPDHYRLIVGDSSRVRHLVPSVERRDYGFVVEHAWSETLTETTSPQQARAASEAMAAIEAAVAAAALRQALGADHDLERLLAWLPGYWAAYRWALTESLIETGLGASRQAGGCSADVSLDAMMAERMARAGYDAAGGDGGTLVRRHAAESIRGPDGAPAGEEVAAAVSALTEWLLDPTQMLPGRWPAKHDNDVDAQLWTALASAMAASAGSVEWFMERERLLADAAWGAWARLIVTNAEEHFRVGVRLPGAVFATNGRQVGDGGAAWDVEGTCAYPSGYVMWARALEPRAEAQLALLGVVRFSSRDEMLALADLVRPDPMLARALARSAASGSLAPLHEFRAAAGTGTRTDRQRRLDQVFRLLGLQAAPPACLTGDADVHAVIGSACGPLPAPDSRDAIIGPGCNTGT